jgi:chorismate synthase
VELATGEPGEAFQERTDVCAVPAAGVVCESVACLVLADAVLEMFAGDTMEDLEAAVERYRRRVAARFTSTG